VENEQKIAGKRDKSLKGKEYRVEQNEQMRIA
jgi:hypothetical protein